MIFCEMKREQIMTKNRHINQQKKVISAILLMFVNVKNLKIFFLIKSQFLISKFQILMHVMTIWLIWFIICILNHIHALK